MSAGTNFESILYPVMRGPIIFSRQVKWSSHYFNATFQFEARRLIGSNVNSRQIQISLIFDGYKIVVLTFIFVLDAQLQIISGSWQIYHSGFYVIVSGKSYGRANFNICTMIHWRYRKLWTRLSYSVLTFRCLNIVVVLVLEMGGTIVLGVLLNWDSRYYTRNTL